MGGWIFYLAFDLLIGAWKVQDAAGRGISHWLVILALASHLCSAYWFADILRPAIN